MTGMFFLHLDPAQQLVAMKANGHKNLQLANQVMKKKYYPLQRYFFINIIQVLNSVVARAC